MLNSSLSERQTCSELLIQVAKSIPSRQSTPPRKPLPSKAPRKPSPPKPVAEAVAVAKLDREAMLQDFAHRIALVSASLRETKRATEGMGEEDGASGSEDVNLWYLPTSAEEKQEEELEELEDEEHEGSHGDDDLEEIKRRMDLLEADLEQTRQALKLRLRDVEAAQRPCFLCNQAKHLAKFCPLWTSQETWRATPDYQDFNDGLGDVALEAFGLYEFEDSSL